MFRNIKQSLDTVEKDPLSLSFKKKSLRPFKAERLNNYILNSPDMKSRGLNKQKPHPSVTTEAHVTLNNLKKSSRMINKNKQVHRKSNGDLNTEKKSKWFSSLLSPNSP